MKPLPTSAKIAALALAGLSGFLIGNSVGGNPPSAQAGDAPDQGRTRRGEIAIGANANPAQKPSDSPLARTLKFERYLATCDLELFPAMLDAEIRNPSPTTHIHELSDAWIARDREAYANWVMTQPAQVRHDVNYLVDLRQYFIERIAREDLDAAWAMADRLGAGDHSKWQVLSTALRTDPAKALELAQAHPALLLMHGGNMGRTSDLDPLDPMGSLPVLRSLYAGNGRNSLVYDGSEYYVSHPEQVEAAHRRFLELPPDAQRHVVNRVERDEIDPVGGVELPPELKQVWRLPAE